MFNSFIYVVICNISKYIKHLLYKSRSTRFHNVEFNDDYLLLSFAAVFWAIVSI